MKIRYGVVTIHIGKPYDHHEAMTFKVKEGSSYISQGMKLGKIAIIDFVEKNFRNPKPKDFRYIESISEIKVNRFTV